jgi:hypothetical protein
MHGCACSHAIILRVSKDNVNGLTGGLCLVTSVIVYEQTLALFFFFFFKERNFPYFNGKSRTNRFIKFGDNNMQSRESSS